CPPAPARRAVGDGNPTNSRITPGVPLVRVTSTALLAIDSSVEDVRQRIDARLVVRRAGRARTRTGELDVTELVEHRHDRHRDQVWVITCAIALRLGASHHFGDESGRDGADFGPVLGEVVVD